MQKSLERTIDRRNDLISVENFKKWALIKGIKKESQELIKFFIDNEFEGYPDW